MIKKENKLTGVVSYIESDCIGYKQENKNRDL